MTDKQAIRLAARAAMLAVTLETASGRRRRPLAASKVRRLARQAAVVTFATMQRREARRALTIT